MFYPVVLHGDILTAVSFHQLLPAFRVALDLTLFTLLSTQR